MGVDRGGGGGLPRASGVARGIFPGGALGALDFRRMALNFWADPTPQKKKKKKSSFSGGTSWQAKKKKVITFVGDGGGPALGGTAIYKGIKTVK